MLLGPLIEKYVQSGESKTSGGWAKDVLKPLADFVDYPRLPTGCFHFDFCAAGGLPFNVPTQMFGPENGGKTTLSLLTAKHMKYYCFRCKKPTSMCLCEEGPFLKNALYVGVEGSTLDPLFLNTLGYDPTNLVTVYPYCGEEAATIIDEVAATSEDCGLIILDSLPGMVPRDELSGTYDEYHIGKQAALIGRFFRRMSSILTSRAKEGVQMAFVFVNQMRANIGAGKFESKTKTACGYAAKHYPRMSVRINQVKSEIQDSDGLKKVINISMSFVAQGTKQQTLLLAGKETAPLAVQVYDGYAPGTFIDNQKILMGIKKFGLLQKTDNGLFAVKNTLQRDTGAPVTLSKMGDLEAIWKRFPDKALAIQHAVIQAARAEKLEKLKEANARLIRAGGRI